MRGRTYRVAGSEPRGLLRAQREALVLGSDPFRADVVVRDVEVSPEHAGIVREPERGSYVLRDLGEVTAVNGETVEGEHRSLTGTGSLSATRCSSTRTGTP